MLSAMQPQPLTVPAAQANLGSVNGVQNNLNVPDSPTGVTAPGSTLPEALASSDNPELQQQYAPEMIKAQIAQQQKLAEPYDLAPGSTRYSGSSPIVTAPLRTNPNQPFNADGTPNKAFQAFEFAKARNAAEVRAEFRAPPKATAPGAIVNPASLFGKR